MFEVKKYIYIVVAALVLVVVISWPFLVKVKVSCRSQYGNCEGQLGSEVNSLTGGSLIKAGKEITKNLKTNFLVSDFSLQFQLPDVLLVDLVIKKPDFALVNAGEGKLILVDLTGEVLAYVKETNLPKANVDHTLPKPGENIGAGDLSALKLMAGVFNMYQVSTGEIQDKTLVVDLPGQIRVLFPLEDEDPQVLLGSLRLIYSKITSSELTGKYSQIDLRFKNPVLR